MNEPLMYFLKEKGKFIGTIFRKVGNFHDAEDIYSDTVLRLLENGHQYRGDSSINTWLYKITRNACIDYLRKKRRHQKLKSLDLEEENRYIEPIYLNPVNPLESLIKSEGANEVRLKVDELDEEQRDFVTLHYFDGLEYSEIVESTEFNLNKVKKILMRARENLRFSLKKYAA